jgi:hypothetical protein
MCQWPEQWWQQLKTSVLFHAWSERVDRIKGNVLSQKLEAGYKENRKNLSEQDIRIFLLGTDK